MLIAQNSHFSVFLFYEGFKQLLSKKSKDESEEEEEVDETKAGSVGDEEGNAYSQELRDVLGKLVFCEHYFSNIVEIAQEYIKTSFMHSIMKINKTLIPNPTLFVWYVTVYLYWPNIG